MKTNEKELKQKIADLEFENSELHLQDVRHLKKIIDLDKENLLLKQKTDDLAKENLFLKNKVASLSVDRYHLSQEKNVLRQSNLQLIVENKKLKEYENDYRVLEFILEECKFKLIEKVMFDIVKNENKSVYFIRLYNIRNFNECITIEITEKQYRLFNLLNLRRI